ncbi:hypothetical protein [Cellulomonas sp. URHD0024]|uniref:hypothetical protein n=1 Tax=Cellulomonas sp. URHD0024 TaxID=1302620 RepID=UPI000422FCD1|nr:hypothetical protein [Cellulomonas sp. URHD0024]
MQPLICAAIAATALLTSCSSSPGQPEPVQYGGGDYPAYPSLADLCSSASVVVTATPVSSTVRAVNLLTNEQVEPDGDRLGPDDMVQTVTTVKADRAVSGRSVDPGELVEVGQPGGVLDGVEYQANQLGLTEGQSFVLFLVEFDGAPAGLLNPTQSGYRIDDQGAIEAPGDDALASELDGRTADATLCS